MRIAIQAKMIGTKDGIQLWLMHLECDSMSDLPAANAYGANTQICVGSTAHVIEDNATLEINSSGNWIQQQAGSSTYTRAEIDAMQTAQAANNAAQQAEINYSIDSGAKNYCPYDSFTAAAAGTVINDQPIALPAGEYIITYDYTETTGSSSIRFLDSGTSIINFTINNTEAGKASRKFTLTAAANQMRFYTGVATTVTNIMIRPAVITDPTFTPYAPTNRELYEMIQALI